MIRIGKQLMSLAGICAIALMPSLAQAQMITPIQGELIRRDFPMGVQRVDIDQTGNYAVLGDETEGLPVSSGNFRRTVIVTAPGHLKVITGAPITTMRPVAYTPTPSGYNIIDSYSDLYTTHDVNQMYGFRPDGRYVPFPQTPDLTIDNYNRTITVDNHLP